MAPCQVISGEGEFKERAWEFLINNEYLIDVDSNYRVIAIMGPQSTGKSTLLNRLFGTSFSEADLNTRQRKTEGIWAEIVGRDSTRLVLDLEGLDSRDREGDMKFEKQSALFALSLADTIIVNLKEGDVGRYTASGLPLLKTILQARMKIKQPPSQRLHLVFVVRDYAGLPLKENLESILRQDLQRVWDTIHYPHGQKPSLQNLFLVSPGVDSVYKLNCAQLNFETFASFVASFEEFYKQIEAFRERVLTPARHLRKRVLPIDGLAVQAKNLWNDILRDQDLDVPSHEELASKMRCEQIANELTEELMQSEPWHDFVDGARSSKIADFGIKGEALLSTFFDRYNDETAHYTFLPIDIKDRIFYDILKEPVREATDYQVQFLIETIATEATKRHPGRLESIDEYEEAAKGFASNAYLDAQEELIIESIDYDFDQHLNRLNQLVSSRVDIYRALRRRTNLLMIFGFILSMTAGMTAVLCIARHERVSKLRRVSKR